MDCNFYILGIVDRRWYMNAVLWMLNPFIAVISTRGNAESVLSFLVLASLYSLMCGNVTIAALLFGLAVHFKVYPIIYAIPIWFGIDFLINQSKKKREKFVLRLFSWNRFYFGIVSALAFFALTYAMYLVYGMEFLQETYLYHITRKDHRHNFSLYFLHMYLSSTTPSASSLLSFVPQLGLVLSIGVLTAHDMALAWFLQTFAFVALNKVCTSQYFMWYLCLLPLVLSSSTLMTSRKTLGLVLLISWIVGQVTDSFVWFDVEK